MPSKKPFDPTVEWQQFVQRTEHKINELSGKVTKTENFVKVVTQAGKLSTLGQRVISNRMESALKSLSLPSKSQVAGLADRLDRIEATLDRLRLAVEAQGETSDPVPRPRRTLQPKD
jgi:SMC interacting uncharacterized protein involved in chromosome segregation